MTISEPLSLRRSSSSRVIGWVFVLASFLGFVDATFLTVEHYRGVVAPCTIAGCEQVLTSAYAVVGSIPVALIGSFYYATLVLLAVLFLSHGERRFIAAASYLALLGMVTTAYLVYLQLFVIRAICLYCMFSAAVTLVLAGAGGFVLRSRDGGGARAAVAAEDAFQ